MSAKLNVYPIRLYGDPVLRAKARPVTDVTASVTVPGFDPAPLQDVARSMLETMYEAHGVGLAAPQVGLPLRVFVAAEYEDDEEEGEDTPPRSRVLREHVMINPVLETLDRRRVKGQEGCLSIPNIFEEDVPRERAVRVRYVDLQGQEQVTEAEDYVARVFQHETDHLNGRLFLDLLPGHVTDEHRKDLVEMQRKAKAYLRNLQPVRR